MRADVLGGEDAMKFHNLVAKKRVIEAALRSGAIIEPEIVDYLVKLGYPRPRPKATAMFIYLRMGPSVRIDRPRAGKRRLNKYYLK